VQYQRLGLSHLGRALLDQGLAATPTSTHNIACKPLPYVFAPLGLLTQRDAVQAGAGVAGAGAGTAGRQGTGTGRSRAGASVAAEPRPEPGYVEAGKHWCRWSAPSSPRHSVVHGKPPEFFRKVLYVKALKFNSLLFI